MRRLAALAVVFVGCAWLVASPRAQDVAAPQQPFRAGVDLIRLDVSVLDRDRHPVRGLEATDFTVLEDGRAQRVIAVSEIDLSENNPTPSAWMRYASRDVSGNDLADQLENGQAVAIVLDELNIPAESEIVVATRDLARYIVTSLGPSDLAAVVFPLNPGKTQDFTQDRSKLFDAIDRVKPELGSRSLAAGSRARPGDVQRYSPIRDPCLAEHPAIPTLGTVTTRLATVPNQRKTIFFLSVGEPLAFSAGRARCQSTLFEELRRTFREAARANVNIHTIDPAGAHGYADQLQESRPMNGRMTGPMDGFSAHQATKTRHDFLEEVSKQTGGRAVINTNEIEAEVDQVFAEMSSYYLVGYETSNGAPDGKFRQVEVKVKKPDTSVRTSAGYWADEKGRTAAARDVPAQNALNLSGMMSPQRLVLRAVLHPVAAAMVAGRKGEVDVVAVLTVRVPAQRQPVPETVTVVRTVSNIDGRSQPPIREVSTLSLEAGSGDVLRYDVPSHFSLPPGRYEVRFNATSRVADASGSVFAEVEVPDLEKSGVVLSGLVLGQEPSGASPETLRAIMPIVPTTARDFLKSDRVRTFVRIFQGGASPAAPVDVTVRILAADAAEVMKVSETIGGDAFGADRAAAFTRDLPLSRLEAGLYLLSVTASAEAGRSARRDVVFRVR